MSDFETEWTRCAPWIEAAIERSTGEHTLDDLKAAVVKGDMQFWPGRESAMISQISVFPRKKYLHVPFIGGNLDEVRRMEATLVRFAKFLQCDGLSGAGRAGWGRAMGGNWKEVCRLFISEF